MWRNTGLPIKFAGVDGRVVLPMLAIMVNLNWIKYTGSLAILIYFFFFYIQGRGFNFANARRYFGVMLAGKIRPAVPSWRRNIY